MNSFSPSNDPLHDDGDTNLDQWIQGGLDAELAQADTAFDFAAGLADVYARAGLPEVTYRQTRQMERGER